MSAEDVLVHWAELLVAAGQAVRHQLHVNRSFIVGEHAAVILNNSRMVKGFEQLAFMEQLFKQSLVLSLHNFDRHPRRKPRVRAVVKPLVNLAKGTFSKQLSSFHILELFSKRTVDAFRVGARPSTVLLETLESFFTLLNRVVRFDVSLCEVATLTTSLLTHRHRQGARCLRRLIEPRNIKLSQ